MKQRFIISLTTLPNRNASLKENLNSLLSQNYSNFEIHLNIPKESPLNGEWEDLNVPNDSYCKTFFLGYIGIEEMQPNSKTRIKITDLMGRETEYKPNSVLIYHYSDGSIQKIFTLN
jgi:hypothetical protein